MTMSPETAIALVKKYAAQHGVREAARIFRIAASSVSRIANDKGNISGIRIAEKIAAAGTMTCPVLNRLLLPEVCMQNHRDVLTKNWHCLKREIRPLYVKCPMCPIGEKLCQQK